MKKRKIIVWLTAIVAVSLLLVAIVIMVCHHKVGANASGRTYDKVEDIPHNKVGLMLATTPITYGDVRNHSFDNRIKAADELYKAGKKMAT